MGGSGFDHSIPHRPNTSLTHDHHTDSSATVIVGARADHVAVPGHAPLPPSAVSGPPTNGGIMQLCRAVCCHTKCASAATKPRPALV